MDADAWKWNGYGAYIILSITIITLEFLPTMPVYVTSGSILVSKRKYGKIDWITKENYNNKNESMKKVKKINGTNIYNHE